MQFRLHIYNSLRERGMFCKRCVLLDDSLRFGARGLDEAGIFQGFHADIGDAPLLFAVQISRAAGLEIDFRELEAVVRFFEGFEAAHRYLAARFRQEVAVWRMR